MNIQTKPVNVHIADRITKACKYSIISYKQNIVSKNIKQIKSQVIVAKEKNDIYVAFRGSCNVLDFKDAVNVIPLKTPNGMVHTGFYSLYETLHNDVVDCIKECGDIQNIHVTGHSRGGSLALIGSSIIKNEMPQIKVSCVMLGAPMTCDDEYMSHSKKIIDDIHCLEVDMDIIPKLVVNPMFTHMNQLTDTLTLISSQNISNVLYNHSCYTYLHLWKKNANILTQ